MTLSKKKKPVLCTMADGINLTEPKVVKQLRLALRLTTKTWNSTSVMSVLHIMADRRLGLKTKRLAEDCFVKFIMEHLPPAKEPFIVKEKDVRKAIKVMPKRNLISAVEEFIKVLNKAEEVPAKKPVR
jgi:hypothetical protein